MNKPRGGLKQRIFAWLLAQCNSRYEQFAAKYKQHLFAGVSGTVLEIGPGTGVNLRYLLDGAVRWIGVEPNLFMKRYLDEEAARLGMRIKLHVGTADALPLNSGSVDVVISTLVLCCVPDQRRSIREILRVLKPGGRLLFIEHVAARPGSRLRLMQNIVTPIWRRLGDGCHPNRETSTELEHAGFAEVRYEFVTAPLPIVSPHIIGVATKS